MRDLRRRSCHLVHRSKDLRIVLATIAFAKQAAKLSLYVSQLYSKKCERATACRAIAIAPNEAGRGTGECPTFKRWRR